ncbi:hrp65 protein-like isoform X3 [Pectinophora gossypiella]|uniref:hrp65 protein-like isoform X3 n=1 Tax=Pectinophora gossypiella TaxID=13191 RepID=UPI00214EB409|nr:hrp65 protein-like isoform X3 [Pectinophora gossypiella]
MQMHAMNQFGRGYGGPPQPQRQGGRRGNRGGIGGFRNNSRFEHNQRNNPNMQGGQRPNNEQNKFQQNKPQQQGVKPVQQQAPAQQPAPANQQAQQQPAQQQPQQQKPETVTPQAQQQKPLQTTPAKAESQDKVDKAVVDQKPQNQGNVQQSPQQNNQAKNVNGGQFGNKQGGWQGGQANKPQGGNFNQGGQGNKPQGGNFGQGGQANKSQGGNFNQGGQANKPQGGNFGQGGQANKPQGGNFGQGGQANKPQGGNFGPGGQANKPQGGSFGQGGQANKPQGGNFAQGGQANKSQGGNFGQGGPNNSGQQNRPFVPKTGGPQGGQQGGPHGGQQGGGPPRNQSGKRPLDGNKPVQREEHMLANKLKELMGPLIDLQPIDQTEVKFNGRSRLYIGNLTNDVSEDEIQNMFKEFGETAELFLNKEKNFGFIKMDYRVNAERAKRELDGKMRSGRPLRVRFAPHNSAVRIKNLPPFVSNELLYRAFEIFGKIERAYVRVDERGKTLGEGVVEYARKPSALAAIRNCTEKCFFLTSSLRPVIVENFEEPDEFDGYPEKNLPKKHPEFLRARELGPRFSEPSSFEHEYGTRWKQLHELHRQKEEALKKELAAEEEKLEAQMEYAKYEHETELLREQLRQREQDRERQKRSWEMAERAAEERREQERAHLLRTEEELSQRMRRQDDELRRRQQENTLFVQAQRLNSMLDRQEQGMFDQQQPMVSVFS